MFKFWGIISLLMLLVLPVKAQEAEVLLVNETQLGEAIHKEFVEQGIEDKVELEFFGGQTNFAIENAKQSKIMISNLILDAPQNKFSANAEIFADGKIYARTPVSGRYYVMGEAWVPAANIDKDTIITEDMLKTIPVRMNRIKAVNLIDKTKLLDMQAKKTLKLGKIINDRDVGKIILIKKGKSVTSIYRTKGLQITAKAEALEEGTRGQRIQVMNTKSGKKFFAVVLDADTVQIEAE